ncbi:MAG TPA: BtpA/SgcQ family protein, partial [Anaerolineales bacterium]|nr:BtpA/SgcQ family protein [Anaerolineales bacterium]
GLYESDMGQWSPNAGEVLRFRNQIGATKVRVFFNIVPEFSSSLGTRNVAQRARSVVVSCIPDVILVSGPMASAEPDIATLAEIKDAVGEVPVFVNTGAKEENIAAFLSIADGVIVGSSLKVDGYTWNPVDPERVARFMARVQKAR